MQLHRNLIYIYTYIFIIFEIIVLNGFVFPPSILLMMGCPFFQLLTDK